MAYIPRKPGRFVRETEGARPREATKDEAAKSRGTVVVAPKPAPHKTDTKAKGK